MTCFQLVDYSIGIHLHHCVRVYVYTLMRHGDIDVFQERIGIDVVFHCKFCERVYDSINMRRRHEQFFCRYKTASYVR